MSIAKIRGSLRGRSGRVIGSVMRGVALCLIGVILLGFTGRVFPPGDSLAVIRPQAGLTLLVVSIALWALQHRKIAMVSAGIALAALISIAPGFLRSEPPCESNCLTLYQKNLLSRAWPRYPLADDIIGSSAQIVTLQEVSDHNRRFMENLFAHYPVSVFCEFRPQQSVAILTSLVAVDGSEICLPAGGGAGVQVILPDGERLWIVSLHLKWPFPYGQFQQTRQVIDWIEALEGPVVIAGDFNMVPWGGSIQRISQAAGTARLGRTYNSFRDGRWWLPLPIDNILVPQGATGSTEMRPLMGSDHLGIFARIALRQTEH